MPINVINGLYTDIQTSIILDRRTGLRTTKINVKRGTIQGDRLIPFIFLCYLEPLLRWLARGNHGYTPSCTDHVDAHLTTQNARAIADDIVLTAKSRDDLLTQFNKIKLYCKWAALKLNPKKSAVTRICASVLPA